MILAVPVTTLPAAASGSVLLAGSHGGRYAGRCALAAKGSFGNSRYRSTGRTSASGLYFAGQLCRHGRIYDRRCPKPRAAAFHDAGIGRDKAGIAALPMFAALGVPAAAVAHDSARTSDPTDMLARGRISRANAPAQPLGLVSGMRCDEALSRLETAACLDYMAPPAEKSPIMLDLPGAARRGRPLLDSASLVRAEDAGAVIIAASHGGSVGGDPAMALRTAAFAAAFHDAGIGVDRAGLGRLLALDQRTIAAIAVAAASARIGDARSCFDDGLVSAVNHAAQQIGARRGERLRDLVAGWAAEMPSS